MLVKKEDKRPDEIIGFLHNQDGEERMFIIPCNAKIKEIYKSVNLIGQEKEIESFEITCTFKTNNVNVVEFIDGTKALDIDWGSVMPN